MNTAVKPKIVYICGMGHNGSTSLDLLLDLHPETLGTSQLNDLLVLYFPSKKESPTERDRFWDQLTDQLSEDQRAALATENESILKERRLLSFIFSKAKRRKYAAANEALIDKLLVAKDRSIIIDSSKNISRCLGLLETKYDLRVIHLTRDVRGYVNSHNKRRGENGLKPIYLKPTLVWLAKNVAATFAAKPKAKHYLHVRYEEMMFRPKEFLQRISDFIELPLEPCKQALMGVDPLKPSDSMGFEGNRVLHGRKDVYLDRNRVNRSGVFQSRLYWMTLGWLSCLWGYRFLETYPAFDNSHQDAASESTSATNPN